MDRIPSADIIEVLGLLELIHDYKDGMPVDEIHNFTGVEFDKLQPVIEAAEMLGFLKLKGQLASLTQEGKALLKKTPHERKKLLAKKISALPVFAAILSELKERESMSVAELKAALHKAGFKGTLDKDDLHFIVMWGTYAALFDYDYENNVIRRAD